MHKVLVLALVGPLTAAACSYPQFVATKVVEMDLPAAGIERLVCQSHNGSIVARAGASADTVKVHAEMKARGYTQGEADDNLSLLSVAHAVDGDELVIRGEYPRDVFASWGPTFDFTIEVPARLALKLESHNGDIGTSGTRGSVSMETHNGSIESQADSPSVSASTHNGDIALSLGGGALDGSVRTHNGSITITLHSAPDLWLDLQTHNGSIDAPSGIEEATVSKRSVRGRLGQGTGKLTVTSHNGSIVFR